MNVLPLALTPKRVLVIGAGKSAARKARALLQSDCELDVVAREIRDDFFLDRSVHLFDFAFDWLETRQDGERAYDIVVNATGDAALSLKLWENRRRLRYWLNASDRPDYCDFYFGATVRDRDLSVSVSTSGASPRYAQAVRDLAAAVLPRREAAFYEELRRHRRQPEKEKGTGKVFLIGSGPGRLDNLTVKALKTLKFLDVALIDALVGSEIVDLLPAHCQRIDVGKRKGLAKYTQEEINALMLRHALEGRQVGRLKGGDPAVFGRLFEEASFLLEHGIETELIGGVPSFLSGCLAGGIAPTLRGVSAGVLVVSAHLAETRFNDDWIPLLKTLPYTVIVLMAWSFAGHIRAVALEHGVPMSLPAAFVSRIDSPKQTTLLGTLGDLEEMAKQCGKPAILVIGEAVAGAGKMPHTGIRKIFGGT
ncbi:MAG: uroporphyrinogen-III C-methyltransferase [Candidatus Accumulibacter sp.]|jgi:uroporphyrin-III C-methyltransferase/precorrin-2 dehydrogenase/sirohydrochlorin ferrochelatase|nr:uroporphyrinogen-III C-methyltransferase [Accumulibacter sp.]